MEPVDAGEIGLKDAALLLSSSSSCCLLARACRSLQVSFFGPEDAGDAFGVAGDAEACAVRSKGLTSFLGGGRLTG